MKYAITMASTFVIEISSTMYISTVSERSVYMLFWAFIGPFLSLPFVGFIVEAKNWKERIRLAFTAGTGYMLGAAIVYFFTT